MPRSSWVGSSPVANVRVQSEQYPSTTQPMSTVTSVPSSMIVSRIGMRPRAVLAGGDDRPEGECLRAVLTERSLDPPGDVRLGAPDDRLSRAPRRRHPRSRSAPDRRQLALVLDRRRASTSPRVGNELGTARPIVSHCAIRDLRRLEPDPPAGEQLGERAGDVAAGLDDLDARRPRVPPRDSGSRCRGSSRVRLDEQRAVRALEAGQVADVDAVGDEQRLGQARGEASRRLTVVLSFRRPSASR